MSRAGAQRGHPDIDRLADLDAGLLQPADERTVRDHLAGCPECSDVSRTLLQTRAALAALPVERLPDDVAARLDNALAEARTESRRETPRPGVVARLRRRSADQPLAGRFPGWLTPAAAAGVAVLAAAAVGVGIAVGDLGGSGGSGGSGAAASRGAEQGGAAATPVRMVASGRDYTSTTLGTQVRAVLGGAPQGGAGSPQPPGSAPTTPHAMPGQRSGGELPGGMVRPLHPSGPAQHILHNAAQRHACLAVLGSGPGGRPLLIDRALYEDQPAAIVVLAGAQPGNVVVDVVGPRCGRQGPDLLARQVVPRR